ncbi:MAG: hypothetical protein II480_07935 [Bacteroidales bacterium]|nr:hypothetical protein [Bacteroidales bacterium]
MRISALTNPKLAVANSPSKNESGLVRIGGAREIELRILRMVSDSTTTSSP